jgi:hypothetical protein
MPVVQSVATAQTMVALATYPPAGLLALGWVFQGRIDGAFGVAALLTAEAATGLGHLGKVRVLEAPHTQPNFVMREMGFRVARKHAMGLRRLALAAAFGVPLGALSRPLRRGRSPRRSAPPRRRCPRAQASPSSAGCFSPRPSTYPCSITVSRSPNRKPVGAASPLARASLAATAEQCVPPSHAQATEREVRPHAVRNAIGAENVSLAEGFCPQSARSSTRTPILGFTRSRHRRCRSVRRISLRPARQCSSTEKREYSKSWACVSYAARR